MLPIDENNFLNTTYEIGIYPSKTYYLDIEKGRIRGQVDGKDSMVQAIHKILTTERYEYPVYSRNYGVELLELIGEPITYVLPELKRRIAEALTWDSRIDSVDNFSFAVEQGKVQCTFTVHTIYGDVDFEKVVVI
ncbi:MAG: DUF2634 domain-containing protein [Eubacteriales bacterium]|nr:DUF2634 domain-containing protein [Eubacteriales bacterium]